ncbi:MAG: helix-turn-helix domain-containing protein, partial [Campylobacterota bacterium]|nr:helix-turn-helix domain-containing protein [Campylobacterota bacterium]
LLFIIYKNLVLKLKVYLDVNEAQLAEKLGITQATLSERKKKNATKFDDVIQLCLNEKIDLNMLFTERYSPQIGITYPQEFSQEGFYNIPFASHNIN